MTHRNRGSSGWDPTRTEGIGQALKVHTCAPVQDTAPPGKNRVDFCPGSLPTFQLQQLDNQKDCFKKEELEEASELDNVVCLGTGVQHPWHTANVKSY